MIAENKVLAIEFDYDGFTVKNQIYPNPDETDPESPMYPDSVNELSEKEDKYIYAFKVTSKGNIIIATAKKLIFLKETSHNEFEVVPQKD